MTVTYADLVGCHPDELTAAATIITALIQGLTHARTSFSNDVLARLAPEADWTGSAADHAAAAGQVHAHALAVAIDELSAAARTLRLAGIDLHRIQQQLKEAIDEASGAGAVIDSDGNVSVDRDRMVSGYGLPPLADRTSEAIGAMDDFCKRRDALLATASAIDAEGHALLEDITRGAGQVIVNSANQQLTSSWKYSPRDLPRIQAQLGLIPTDHSHGHGAMLIAAVSELTGLVGLSNDRGRYARESVSRAAQLLSQSPDPAVRSTSSVILRKLGTPTRLFATDLSSVGAKALPAVDFLLNIARYSHSSGSIVEIAAKSTISSAASTAGASVGGFIGTACALAWVSPPPRSAAYYAKSASAAPECCSEERREARWAIASTTPSSMTPASPTRS